MSTLALMMAGIPLLAITIFVHKHTYDWCTEEKAPFPVWFLLFIIVVAFLPLGINLFAFTVGAVVYLFEISIKNIMFKCESKWWECVKRFLTKDIG